MKNKITDTEILTYVSEHPDALQDCMIDGMMDLDSVRSKIMEARKNEILQPYIGSIKRLEGNDRRYYIHVYEDGKRKKLRAKTYEDLLSKIYEWHVSQQDQTHDPGDMTIRDIYPLYVKHKMATTWTEATRKRNDSTWRSTIMDADLMDRSISSVSLPELKEWAYGTIRDHRLTKKEWHNVAGIVGGIFEFAEISEWISKNPWRLLRVSNKAVFRQPEQRPVEECVLDPESEMRLYQTCLQRYQDGVYPVNRLLPLAIMMLWVTGMRPSEVCCIKYTDVHDDMLCISRYYSEAAGELMDEHTKAGHGSRTVDLTDMALSIIDETRRFNAAHGIDTPYVFTQPEHMASLYNRMRKTMPSLCKAAGISHNSPYGGRRTFISASIDAGINIDTVRAYVGHKDAKTTLNSYTFDRSDREQKRRKLESARPGLSWTQL